MKRLCLLTVTLSFLLWGPACGDDDTDVADGGGLDVSLLDAGWDAASDGDVPDAGPDAAADAAADGGPPPNPERVLFDDTIDWQWPTPQDYGGYGFYWWHRNGEPGYSFIHYGEMPTDDWTAPADYEHGTVHLRFEVISQPTSRPFRIQLGIWQDYGLQPHHRECIGPHNDVAGGAGSSFADSVGSTFADWWNHPSAPGPCDFTRPEDFYRIGIVLWDQASSCIPMGHDWSTSGCPELQAEFFPMTARVTAVAVPTGETFSGWASYP